ILAAVSPTRSLAARGAASKPRIVVTTGTDARLAVAGVDVAGGPAVSASAAAHVTPAQAAVVDGFTVGTTRFVTTRAIAAAGRLRRGSDGRARIDGRAGS